MTTLTSEFAVERVKKSRVAEVDFNNLEFGRHISDHMVVVDYENGQWGSPSIVPFGEMKFSPAMLSLHYGQAVFEGMKAFHTKDGSINIFRPHKHLDRFNKSLHRMCMPSVPEELWLSSLKRLIEIDKEWVPKTEGASLYIRPFMFATESRLGVKVSDTFKFVILTSPVGPYQAKPYRLKVENKYVRTAEGGTGFAKCAGNYGGAFYPTQIAREEGFDQILWTDSKEHKYIDEVGMMNVMFVLNGKLVTPQLSTAILDGITRDSILTLAKEMAGFSVEERKVSIDEIEQGFIKGTLTEAFGTGTAAVVAPISVIHINGTDYQIPSAGPTSFQLQVKQKLHNIRMGLEPDTHEWNYLVKV
ncbi:branched-chain amino acid aminotransferase [Chryseosolibacter indicus]|uniref:branched-chain-amino-acid transaminase n=1 Tax=Chryseosolibacter indicus TaxID=2782351 RepID=A0ABS5VZQ7_9BACT|nr:branched-chain amino acid aminotransferase [Chryseosolibacter indicus]MBT1705511.1 branched-chain amino acid aminotransferase [Chryseosolibacter indicus]